MPPANPQAAKWQPPENYTQIPSKVEGITVFAENLTPPEQPKPRSFKCPQCGATTQFDVAAGGVACEHCGYSTAVESQKIGKQAVENEFTLEALKKGEQGWGEERRLLHCTSCGAEIILDQKAISNHCPFCASNEVNLADSESDHLRPRFLVPFKILPQSNQTRTKTWLGKGWYHPDGLSASAIIARFIGIYLPFWTFDANIYANWKAEVGYEHTVRHYDASSKSWKTHTQIRWRWETGQVHLPIDDLVVPASAHISRHIFNQIMPFNLEELETYNPGFLAGWQAQAYEINLPDAWETGKAVMRERVKESCYANIPTSHVRNFSMQADFTEESWRYILLPLYLAAYRYENKTYQVMINGQSGLIAGQKPVAWWKIWLAIAALLLPGVLLGAIGVPLLLLGGVGILPLLVGFILLIVGGIIAFILYKNAKDSEAI
ncbi:MAG: hypothetical protein IT308_11540 [Anaerolineaceae bacterium]|nr:hypothetical protein [Anaerolineaceae bacterium]